MGGLIGDFKLCEKLSSMLMTQFNADGLLVEMNDTTLQKNILTSMLHHDVPYFTELSGTIYYGMPSEEHVIARKEVKK